MQNENRIHIWPDGKKFQLWALTQDKKLRASLLRDFPQCKEEDVYVTGRISREEVSVLCLKHPSTKVFPDDDELEEL